MICLQVAATGAAATRNLHRFADDAVPTPRGGGQIRFVYLPVSVQEFAALPNLLGGALVVLDLDYI
jgi:hypothetical protein